jgi:integrase
MGSRRQRSRSHVVHAHRYTGERKGDCCDVRRSDIDLKGNSIHLVQEKTGIRMWVPLHKRLKQYLAALPRRGDHILTSQVTGKRYSKQAITNYITTPDGQ